MERGHAATFPIPMRGNEIGSASFVTITNRVSDPHEG